MRKFAALAVIAAIATLVPVVAWASLSSGSCCAAKNAPSPAPMSCCTKTKCSMSGSGPIPIAPNETESTAPVLKTSVPGPALVDGEAPACATPSARLASGPELVVTAVSVDRRLALLSTYLI
jgi:hypothetical protein